ncbi:hypothetical protein [Candidatus Uabimicrobium amorphum]|uniref:Uncharacterized protein n=1 Tax=Uabimicrobium amorphum TaxID=2596890 RepID=A0A5S9IJV7_UABAM|nr:hypothetical protein [Candidatus Uabimicrobium amorphum]BBM83183.1 hypothetical protein UABAM_01534 [Candidatus Uabimicrobium amorphum]
MYLELAKKYLDKARNASGSTRNYFANLTKVCLAKSAASPADIGTDDQELTLLSRKIVRRRRRAARIKSKNPVQICQEYLQKCRDNNCTNRQYFANLCRTTLTNYNLTPEEIGTNQEELDYLQNQGFLESAKKYLLQARCADGAKRKCYADLCSEYLDKGKGSPEDIGADQDELAELAR